MASPIQEPGSWWRRSAVAFAGGAAATLIVVGVGLLITGPDTENVPSSEPPVTTPAETTTVPSEETTVPSSPTTTVPPSPTTTVTTSPAPSTTVPASAGGVFDADRWDKSRVTGIEASVLDVAAGEFGFVATGLELGQYQMRGVVWYSADGAKWERVAAHDEGYLSLGILADGAGAVVWGDNTRQGGTYVAHSVDGRTWDLVSDGAAPLDERATKGLALDGGGFLLYGGESRVLTSSDGRTWERYETPSWFRAVVQTDAGDLLAVGRDTDELALWVSGDRGRSWDRVADGMPPGRTSILGATPHGIVAAEDGLGSSIENPAPTTFWLSGDGATFTEALVPSVADRIIRITSITPVGGTVIAVGQEEFDLGSDDWRIFPVFLVSDDGLHWREVDLRDLTGGYGGWLRAVAVRNGVVVVVGADHTNADGSGNGFVLRLEMDDEAGGSPDPGG